jgi:hypothetical protein
MTMISQYAHWHPCLDVFNDTFDLPWVRVFPDEFEAPCGCMVRVVLRSTPIPLACPCNEHLEWWGQV